MENDNKLKIKEGLFVVIEGSDGSGKTEQSKRLISYFKRNNKKVVYLDFPRYRKRSSYFVKKYLNGEYGDLYQVSSRKAAIFYALDRFDASFELKKYLQEGYIVISNRYFGSNLIHQGAKISSKKERIKFYQWITNLEFKILEIPKPDLNILLYLPAKISYKLAKKSRKRKAAYLKKRNQDIHEGDFEYLRKVEKIILEIPSLYPEDFKLLKCFNKKGEILPISVIQEKIRLILLKLIKRKQKLETGYKKVRNEK